MRISPWKSPKTFLEILKLSKLPAKNIETVSKAKHERDFSPSQDMDVGNYLNGGKSLEEQDSLVETWIVIGESELV